MIPRPREYFLEFFRASRVASLFLAAAFLFALCNPSALSAQEHEQARTAVENLAAEIRMAEAAVGQTLMEAMRGKHGELKRWEAMEDKMNVLGQTIDRNLPEIGRNAAILIDRDPNVQLPSVRLGQTFYGNLRMATNRERELLELAKAENRKLQTINNLIARANEDLLNAAKDYMVSSIGHLLPSEALLAGLGGAVVLGALFPPVGVAAAAGAVGIVGAFNFVVEQYYAVGTAADQVKKLSQMRKLFEEQKRQIEQNIKTLMDGARELHQIERILDRQNKRLDEYRKKVDATAGNWMEAGFERRKQRLKEDAQKFTSRPRPATNLWQSGLLGKDPIPPIQPEEYMDRVNSMISRMESYTRAVEDGGDPANFEGMVADWNERSREQLTRARDEYTQKRVVYDKASYIRNKHLTAAFSEFSRASGALRDALGTRRRDAAFYAASHAISVRLAAAVKAADAALYPFGQALIKPFREIFKIQFIHKEVFSAAPIFRARIDNAIWARSHEFNNALGYWGARFHKANYKAYHEVADLPLDFWRWRLRSEQLDAQIAQSIRMGDNIERVRAGLLSSAEHLKELDGKIKQALKAYDEAKTESTRISNQARAELGSLLVRYGRLINSRWADSNPWSPWSSADQERMITGLSQTVKSKFEVRDPLRVARLRETDLLDLARKHENKARELTFYTDWIERYRYRLSTAVTRLNRISMEQTNQRFYAKRDGTAWAVASREFSEPPWASIVKELDKYVSPEETAKLLGIKSLEGEIPWRRLQIAQETLLRRMQKYASWYVMMHSHGIFQPLPADVIKPFEEAWKGLRAISERHDALVKPLRDRMGNSLEEAQQEVRTVRDVYNKMPGWSRHAVVVQDRLFTAAARWLLDYLSGRRDMLNPVMEPPANSVALKLDDLILGYAPAYARWKRKQEELQRRIEEERRLYAEKQRRLKEEQQRRLEEEERQAAARIKLIQDFYAAFRQAFESRNDSLVMSKIGDKWESGDGTTLADMQANLRRSFRTFDEIRVQIQNLQIAAYGPSRFIVSYDLTLASRITRRNIRHQEKSTVREEVTIDDRGRPKITRTKMGQFWFAK